MLSQCWKNRISRSLYRLCPLCHLPMDSHQHFWCSFCRQIFRSTRRCSRCGLPIETEGTICGRCLSSPPLWHRLTCIGDYNFPLNQYIHQIKHQRKFWLISPFADLLNDKILLHKNRPQLMSFVPLHWERFLIRGFNQSEQLAQAIANKQGIPNQTLFTRQRKTPPQQGLSREQRWKNLSNAFCLKRSPSVEHIALVDDVVTTGATLSWLCKILLDVGIKYIDIYCICRTPEPN